MLHDLRFALRQLFKTPGFSLIAILTLALAIGSNVAIFSAIDAVLLHPLPYHHPEQLVSITENLTHFNLLKIPASPPEVIAYRKMATGFSYIGADAAAGAFSLTGDGTPEMVPGMQITANLFPMLGVKPVLGALFSEEAEQYGKHHVVLISEGLWKRRYGSDPSVLGRNLEINRESYKVVGVIRPILEFRFKSDVYVPLAFPADQTGPQALGRQYLDVIGRLKPGVTLEQARAEFRGIAAAIQRQYPDQYLQNYGYSLDVDPLVETVGANLRKPLLVLLGAVGAVMLIACANLSNLLLARAIVRRKEISIRAALGAARSRVIRQLLTESLLLAIGGGAVGVGLAVYGLYLYSTFGPPGLIRGQQPQVNLWVLGFTVAISALASVIFGLAPAMETSRIDLSDALKEGSRGSSGGRRFLRESMVAVEVAISLVLLIGAGLLVRSFVRLESSDAGFNPRNILTAAVVLPGAQYPVKAQHEFRRAVMERVRSMPGVLRADAIDFLPFSLAYSATDFTIVGHPRNPNDPTPVVIESRTGPDYFQTMSIPLRRGRLFTASDEQGAPPVAIIDETVAKKFFANLDPIGMQISGPVKGVNCTIVGIVGAVKYRELSLPPEPIIYYPAPQFPIPAMSFAIKTAGDPLALAAALRHEVAALDPNLPIARVGTEEQRLAESLARQRFSIQLMSVFATIAAILAAIGIFGVLAFLIDQRRRELGIRIALGASPGNVLGLVLRQGSLPVAAGLIFGIGGAFGLTWYLKSLLYEVSSTDPLTFAGVTLGLIAVATLAMSIPARRATRVDPLEALRHE